MNIKKVYEQFIEKYPSFAKNIESYEDGGDNSIKFILKDGKTAYFFPLVANGKIKKKKKSKKPEELFKQIVVEEEDAN